MGKISSHEAPPWYYRPWIVVLLLIFVLGPFGLPLVYKSPQFNGTTKILLTVLMVFYTWYLGVVTIETMKEIFRKYPELKILLG